MRRLLLAIPALFLLSAAPVSAAELKLSKYARVYKGDEGLVVTVVAVMPLDSKQALVEVSGVDTAIDGVVMLHKEADGKALETTLHGDNFWTIQTEESWYGWQSLSVTLPESVSKKYGVYYDEGRSKKVQIDAFLKKYEKQSKDGTIAKLAAFNRADRVKYNDKEYAEELKSTNNACGTAIVSTLDWKGVNDELLKAISIYGYCSPPLSAVRHICNKSAAEKAKVAKTVKKITCTFGSKLGLKLGADGTLGWTTAKDSANQDDFAQHNLENQM